MSDDNDEPNVDFGPSDEGPEWDNYRVSNEEEDTSMPLEFSDYIALFIASLQTIFLPLLLLVFSMVIISLIFTFVLR